MARLHAFGPYQLVERIGVGAMGEVYRAVARRDGRVVALKRIMASAHGNAEGVAMLQAEASLGQVLDHPAIAKVADVGQVEGVHYIAYEYVHGRDLRALQDRAWRRGVAPPSSGRRSTPDFEAEPVALDVALYIVLHIAEALAHAHGRLDAKGRPLRLVHRDVSPSNVLVSFDGAVKLLDFGIARATMAPLPPRLMKTDAGQIKGTVGYMSPEQVLGEPIDARSDIYSLGICLWELCAGRRLLDATLPPDAAARVLAGDVPAPRSVGAKISVEMERVLLKALAKSPDQRYPAAAEFHADLSRQAVAEGLHADSVRVARYVRSLFPEAAAEEAASREEFLDMADNKGGSDLDVFEGLAKKAARPTAPGLTPPPPSQARKSTLLGGLGPLPPAAAPPSAKSAPPPTPPVPAPPAPPGPPSRQSTGSLPPPVAPPGKSGTLPAVAAPPSLPAPAGPPIPAPSPTAKSGTLPAVAPPPVPMGETPKSPGDARAATGKSGTLPGLAGPPVPLPPPSRLPPPSAPPGPPTPSAQGAQVGALPPPPAPPGKSGTLSGLSALPAPAPPPGAASTTSAVPPPPRPPSPPFPPAPSAAANEPGALGGRAGGPPAPLPPPGMVPGGSAKPPAPLPPPAPPPPKDKAPGKAAVDMDWDDEEESTHVYDKADGELPPLPMRPGKVGAAAALLASSGGTARSVGPTAVPATQHPASVPPPPPVPTVHTEVPPRRDEPTAIRPRPIMPPPPAAAASRLPLFLGGAALLVAIAVLGLTLWPKKGAIKINVDARNGAPVGAVDVYIDGQKRCEATPCVITDLDIGSKTIKVIAPGFLPAEASESIEAKTEKVIRVTLESSGGSTPAATQVVAINPGGGAGVPALKIAGTEAEKGVHVSVDGADKGTLPLEIRDLSSGSHVVRFDGGERYEKLEQTVDVVAGQTKDLGEIKLKVKKGQVTLDIVTTGVAITLVRRGDKKTEKKITDSMLKSPPVRLDIDTSESWRLVATRKGYEDFTQDLTFEDGQADKTVKIELFEIGKPPPPTVGGPLPDRGPPPERTPPPERSPAVASGTGTLNINSIPVSKVILDGKPLGSTPKVGVSVPAGSHTVTFIHPELGKQSVTVQVKNGETKTAAVKFKAP